MSECDVWKGEINNGGYGIKRVDGRRVYAHRWYYEKAKGAIPNGLQIDHLCRNRACVNPSHLEAVTQRENILRGTSPCATHAIKTACPQGHPYDDQNTYVRVDGGRGCRACRKEQRRKHYEKERMK